MRSAPLFLVLYILYIGSANGFLFAQPAVTYETTADWGTEFNGLIRIANDDSGVIRNWSLEFDFDRSINIIWDATIVAHSGNHYVIGPASWNGTIGRSTSVTFGFGGGPGNVTDGPQNFHITAAAQQPPSVPLPGTVNVTITQTAVWSGGFSATAAIENSGTADITGWTWGIDFDQTIDTISGGSWKSDGNTYTVAASSPDSAIPANGQIVLGLLGSGTLTATSFHNCQVNGVTCGIAFKQAVGGVPAQAAAILIEGVDSDKALSRFTIPQGKQTYVLKGSGTSDYTVSLSNSTVANANITPDGKLQLTGVAPGRTSLKIEDKSNGAARYVGVRVLAADGSLPGLPRYLSMGSVSEDTPDDLSFWQAFQAGPMNKRVDIRYIYLNGGPFNGWDTWSNDPGGRATNYIRNSQMLGIIPFFVFYNIPDGGESFYTDLSHVQDSGYMQAYFKNLKLTLDIIARESPDDTVGIILEPDFLGYLAQNADKPAAAISAMTSAAYASHVLSTDSDPLFPDTVQGLVQAINYTIRKFAPHAYFGWQMNLWASPAGGWTTPVPQKGLMHVTDSLGIADGRASIYSEGAAITKYYLDAGIASYGAKFVSVDKYGLDATGFESSAAQNPANSTWFWNNDLWQNYLTFVKAMHDTSQLPVILWQLPVGHINSSLRPDPYNVSGVFPDLSNSNRALEDSAPTFFFGDKFQTSGARQSYFAKNDGNDPSLATDGATIQWGSHLSDAAANGVISILFGAGVGASTNGIGNPPTDNYWWIRTLQAYYESVLLLSLVP